MFKMFKTDTSAQKINDFLERGVKEVISRESVINKLSSGKPIRVKHGVDPSGQDLHIGHAAVYLKLRDLQEMGHKIVFMIGGFTGRFGDPTDKTKARVLKSKKETDSASKDYIKQIGRILDIRKLEIRTNSEWYDNMSAEDMLKLMSNLTVDQMLERDMFQERRKKNEPIHLHEIAYPVLQGYDSVMLKSDMTVIGTDQVFNENVGRDLQKKYGQEPQDIVAIDILTGTDGVNKMGKSLNNYVAINEKPEDQFGKVMSIPDSQIIPYFTLATRVDFVRVKEMEKELLENSLNPMKLKLDLAEEIVRMYHSQKEAAAARENFKNVFSKRETPEEIKTVKISSNSSTLIDLVVSSGLVNSKTDARRLIQDGAIDVSGITKKNPEEIISIDKELILKIGKHRFVKIVK
jgi:tyrosyl-tRNA synthetase